MNLLAMLEQANKTSPEQKKTRKPRVGAYQKNNTSGCPGVSWFERDKGWRVVIKRTLYGVYKDKEEAIRVATEVKKLYI